MDHDREQKLKRGDLASKKERGKAFEMRMDMIQDATKRAKSESEIKRLNEIKKGNILLYNKYHFRKVES